VVFRPPWVAAQWQTMGGWWHIDQHYKKQGRRFSIQGLLSVYHSDLETGSIALIPGSHLRHDEYSSRVRDGLSRNAVDHSNEILNIPRGEPALNLKRVTLALSPGDLVLWDSRTIHSGSPPRTTTSCRKTPGSFSPGSNLTRIAPLISMSPRDLANETTLTKRRLAVDRGHTTTHLPHEFILSHDEDESWRGKHLASWGDLPPLARYLVGERPDAESQI